MVESAVIAGFMVIVLACLWAAYSYQSAKIAVMDEARVDAWQAALKPCEGESETLSSIGASTQDSKSGPLPSTKQADQFLEVGATSLAKDSGFVDVRRTRTVTFPGVIGGESYDMKGRMYLRCNEPAAPENPKDLFMTALGVAKYLYAF